MVSVSLSRGRLGIEVAEQHAAVSVDLRVPDARVEVAALPQQIPAHAREHADDAFVVAHVGRGDVLGARVELRPAVVELRRVELDDLAAVVDEGPRVVGRREPQRPLQGPGDDALRVRRWLASLVVVLDQWIQRRKCLELVWLDCCKNVFGEDLGAVIVVFAAD